MTERDQRFLSYIQESIERIEAYATGGRDTFLRDPMIQDAVLRRLETLADATGKLSADLKARHPEISWREVHGFRNVAAHAYLELSLDRVWEIVERFLPALKAVAAKELRPKS